MFEQIAMGNEAAILRLIKGGVPVDTLDDSSAADSTLHWACSFGSTNVAAILLSNGCPVNILNADNQSPLHLACKGKHFALIELLLEEGANTSTADKDGKTPSQLLPVGCNPQIEALLQNPPVASRKLYKEFERAQEELAAKRQLELQQKLLKESTAAQERHPLQDQQQHNHHQQPEVPVGTDLFGDGDGVGEYDGAPFDSFARSDSIDLEGTDHTVAHHGGHNNNNNRSHDEDDKELLLIFWPPVKRQQHKKNAAPLVVKNNANLLISVASAEIDVFPLLTWSGLMDVMDAFGFQVQVKRSSLGAKIRMCIDKNICPIGSSYELKVTKDQIYLTAGDGAGLLYGVYTLIQLLKLHSEAQVDAAGVTTLTIPAISMSDRPDVAQRAVLWSYRQQVRTSSIRMHEHIELLSRLRINTLFLVIDPVESNTTATHTSTGSNNNNAALDNHSKTSAQGAGKSDSATTAADVSLHMFWQNSYVGEAQTLSMITPFSTRICNY